MASASLLLQPTPLQHLEKLYLASSRTSPAKSNYRDFLLLASSEEFVPFRRPSRTQKSTRPHCPSPASLELASSSAPVIKAFSAAVFSAKRTRTSQGRLPTRRIRAFSTCRRGQTRGLRPSGPTLATARRRITRSC